ncbi:MAG: hypothetical protein HYZ75_10500 [Elusimicrobia bacterium]|nr:hypothetical protein [Elusimicrobiota bacterium]
MPTNAKLDHILEGIEFVAAGQLIEHTGYICKKTGEVHCYSEDCDEKPADFDPNEHIALPDKRSLDLGKELVFRFTREFLSESQSDIRNFFRKRGAFAKFKVLLEQKQMLQHWYDYEHRATEEAVRGWCEANEIVLDRATGMERKT